MKTHHTRRLTSLWLLAALALAGCGVGRPQLADDGPTAQAAPTVSSIFAPQPSPTRGPTSRPTDTIVPSPQPTADPTVVAQATISAIGEEELEVLTVYDDALSSDWSVRNSFQTLIDLSSEEYVDEGSYAISAEPRFTTGILYFTLNQGAREELRRDRVQGLRFYLSGGDEPLGNEVLTVSVVGSNAQPYWAADDQSVQLDGRVTDDQPVFSETRLSFLNINTAIPPKTFVEVTVWLDDLLYDPTYTYVTGFYLKTDRDSVPTFYVDKISLLLLPEGIEL